jgi:hypothetical protein
MRCFLYTCKSAYFLEVEMISEHFAVSFSHCHTESSLSNTAGCTEEEPAPETCL